METTLTQKEENININDILSQLEGVRRSGRGYIAKCPAHNDRSPSLSIAQGNDGRILLYCHAGCLLDDVCKAIRISVNQLFPDCKTPGQKKKYRKMVQLRNTEKDFEELKRRAFIAMVEFRNQTRDLCDYYKLDIPDDILKAVHWLPMIEHYIEILTNKTNEEQLELLREGVLTKWAHLNNLQNKTLQ